MRIYDVADHFHLPLFFFFPFLLRSFGGERIRTPTRPVQEHHETQRPGVRQPDGSRHGRQQPAGPAIITSPTLQTRLKKESQPTQRKEENKKLLLCAVRKRHFAHFFVLPKPLNQVVRSFLAKIPWCYILHTQNHKHYGEVSKKISIPWLKLLWAQQFVEKNFSDCIWCGSSKPVGSFFLFSRCAWQFPCTGVVLVPEKRDREYTIENHLAMIWKAWTQSNWLSQLQRIDVYARGWVTSWCCAKNMLGIVVLPFAGGKSIHTHVVCRVASGGIYSGPGPKLQM